MKLTVIFDNINPDQRKGNKHTSPRVASEARSGDLLKFAVGSEPLRSIIQKVHSCMLNPQSSDSVLAVPYDWTDDGEPQKSHILCYKENIPLSSLSIHKSKKDLWHIISNGSFIAYTDYKCLCGILAKFSADVVAVNIQPQLSASREKVLISAENKLVGFRRFYKDMAQFVPLPSDWPHHIFIRPRILEKLFADDALPLAFPAFVRVLVSNLVTMRALDIAGAVFGLDTEGGLLGFLTMYLQSDFKSNNRFVGPASRDDNVFVADNARLFGKILLGKNVRIDQDTVIVGPTVISDGAKVSKGAIVRSSIIGPDVSVASDRIVQNQLLLKSPSSCKLHTINTASGMSPQQFGVNNFRIWPKFSYPGHLKRIADIVGAVVTIILFAPVIPFIALAIKFNSPGPVFFKTRRQGLHGTEFQCLKFRTMLVGADEMQDRLRAINQIDGPQFKIQDDPRVSTVGGFLRDTYIDEIPQFYNVLLGQMSIVGPRPSPEAENTLCPSWRDARLSVRPGITGLWQVSRTRQPMKDFQEWIYYDTEYVKKLSLKLDLWICYKTAKKMAKNFISQF